MHDLAVTYHFQSPWENHHLAASLRLLLKPEHAFLSVRAVRLATPMPAATQANWA